MDEKRETERRRLREKLGMASASNQSTYGSLLSADVWAGREHAEKIMTAYRIAQDLQRKIDALLQELA